MRSGFRRRLQGAVAACAVLFLGQLVGNRAGTLAASAGRSAPNDRMHNAPRTDTGHELPARAELGKSPGVAQYYSAISRRTQSTVAAVHGDQSWLCGPDSPSPVLGPSIPIGHNLPPAGAQGYEASDVVWHPRLNKLFTVHDGNASLPGSVTMLDLEGGGVQNWVIGQDLEGITVADPDTNFVYLAVEQPNDSVLEFDFISGLVTRTWDLTNRSACTSGCEADGVPFPAPPSNDGIEAITFVPDSGPSGGVFYLGLQSDGRIYKVRLDLTSSTGRYSYLGHAARLGPWAGDGGVAVQGLHYDRANDVLWALVGGTRTRAVRPGGEYLAEWLLPEPEGTQEGITLANESCQFVVAWDDYEGGPTNRLRKYAFQGCISECSDQDCAYCASYNPPAPAPGAVRKNRYLSFVMGSTGCSAALRVTFSSLPAPFSAFNGSTMWVGPPHTIGEGSTVTPNTASQLLMGVNLQNTPHCMDWSEIGVVYVFDDEIVPGARYDLQSIHCTCDTELETNYSAALTLLTSRWGDVVGDCGGGACSPPDGDVDFNDVAAVVDRFRNFAGAVERARADLAGDVPDTVIDFLDISCAADAFRGIPYPFSGPHGDQ